MTSLQLLLNDRSNVRGDEAENANLLPNWALRKYLGWCIIFRNYVIWTTSNVRNSEWYVNMSSEAAWTMYTNISLECAYKQFVTTAQQ